MLRFAALVLTLLCSIGLVEAQTTSLTRKELAGVRHAGPGAINPSTATFAIGMNLGSATVYVDTAKSSEAITVTGVVRPETGQVGQVVDVFVVERVNLTSFLMRNASGAFVPWNGSVASLTPYMKGVTLGAELNVNMFSGKLSGGDHRFFLGYMAADGILRYTNIALRLDIQLDTDGDGLIDTIDPDDDNDGVLDADDPYPLIFARTMKITAAFPSNNGMIELPDYPTTRQLTWILAQLSATTTSQQEIAAHFSTEALTATNAAQWQTQFQTWRTESPRAIVIEVISATPVRLVALIGTSTNQPGTGRYLVLTTKYADGGLIDTLTADKYPLNAFVTTPENQSLTMAQEADKLLTHASGASVLVAKIVDNQCVPIEQRNADTPRATGSIFKEWVLGALGQAVNDGVISPTATVPLVATEVVRNSVLSKEPVGTPFPLSHMATLMMGISDNTATDHIHQLMDRSRIETILAKFNNTHPELLTPFLSVNEQFNLLSGVSLAQAQAYASGTEQQQRTILETVLAPLGPVKDNQNNAPIFITGSWQASPMDICAAMAAMRNFNDRTEGFKIIDRAFSSEAALPFVRNKWERVWYKGGSLGVGGLGTVVLTHSWMVESDRKGTFVVVAMANDLTVIKDSSNMIWELARILQILDQQNP